ncbi:MAG: DUF1684 domain-containing protein [Actinomycetales bacterium]|nr:DUF1684 domain-containing protein [Actinomycetales bacterium]
MTDSSSTISSAPQSPEEVYTTFRARRHEMSRLPQGSLALINTQWFYGPAGEQESVWGVPGLWAARAEGELGIELTATATDGIVLDGSPVDGGVFVFGRDADVPSSISFADGKTGTVIRGEDDKYALRVWDANSEDLQNFGSIDAFAYDPSWVIHGTFTPIEGGRSLGISHLKDEGAARDKVIPGEISFTFNGVDYNPAGFKEGRALMIVFSDATSGDTSYSVGRFLMVAPNADGTITLDFNRAYLPPCAFSYNFNCPMPPAQNRFPFAVLAGEKNVLNKAGELLH